MSALDLDGIDWEGLRALRARFLVGSAGDRGYWTPSLLESYDRTFGERIGWKWDHVLDELEMRGWTPPRGPVLDWGCGTGVAGRRFLGRFPDAGPLVCFDRHSGAQDYARTSAENAGWSVVDAGDATTVVVSHVLSELDEPALTRLLEVVQEAVAVVWVEPGDRSNGRRLSAIRDRLLGRFGVVAPCTHQQRCPLLGPDMERHWCHHFAPPPGEVFTDPGWGRFSAETGIDLRSAPMSFIVMDRRPVADPGPGAVHVIGRPRLSKPEARVFGCDAHGATDARITKRRLPDLYRLAKKGRLADLATWTVDDDEVISFDAW